MSTEEKKTTTKKVEKPAKSSAKKLAEDFKAAETFGKLWLEKERSKEGTFKKNEELEAAEKAMKDVKGLKAVKSQTLWCKRVKLTIIKDYPVSEKFEALFTDKQKKQYFK